MNLLLDLFLSFTKIGLFTFGGGLAMIPIIEASCVEEKKWITHEEMLDITVIAESTPGPIAINCATFVGYKKKGVSGAIAATLGVVLPSFIILCLISFFLDRFLEIKIIANAFQGIKLAVGLLILDAAINMIRKLEKKTFPVLVMSITAIIMLIIDFFGIHFSSILLMLIAGIISLFFTLIGVCREKAGDRK